MPEGKERLVKKGKELLAELIENDELRDGVSVAAYVVWDPVEALGPRLLAGIPQPTLNKMLFVNSALCQNIKLIIQAWL